MYLSKTTLLVARHQSERAAISYVDLREPIDRFVVSLHPLHLLPSADEILWEALT